jgi:AraC-like DNA-binding protein
MHLLTAAHADDLSALLERINVRSVVYCLSDLGAPWGFRVEDSAVAKFHLVLAGSASLAVDADPPTRIALETGELVLLAQGSGHVMQDRGDSPTRPLDRILAEHPVAGGRLTYGGNGPRTLLLCGGFTLGHGMPGDLLGLLPPVLVLDAVSNGVTRWLEPIFGLLRDEVASDVPGATAVLAKIADVFLTQTVRSYMSGMDAAIAPAGPAAAADPVVGKAVTLLLRQPDAPWTVASLAGEVGVSRTAFAARFRELVGEPPMAYLTRLRLGHAAGYLSTTDKTLQQIARLVGYESDAALSKAFRRAFGRAPGAYRREQLAVPAMQATLETLVGTE